MLFFYFVRLLFIEGIDVLEMALYRAACNIIDNTITTVLSRWGGFSPNLAVITHSPPQHNKIFYILLRHCCFTTERIVIVVKANHILSIRLECLKKKIQFLLV